jgi:hypothetical protein
MTHSHDFPTALRVLEYGTLDVLVELHDPDNGVLIGESVTHPRPNQRQARVKGARAHGSYGVGARLDDDGTLIVPITIEGATWAQQQTRQGVVYEALRSADRFYVEEVLSGVTTRWYCDAPVDIFPEPVRADSRIRNELGYELHFLVQPNPAVTIA